MGTDEGLCGETRGVTHETGSRTDEWGRIVTSYSERPTGTVLTPGTPDIKDLR